MTSLILKLAEANKQGFTVSVETLKPITKGIAVAYAETQNCFDSKGLEKVIEHSLNNSKVIGGWFDTESKRYYFDSIKIFQNSDLNQAIEFGKQNGQIAIFDLTNLREIRL